jgi:hypothetical protein
MAYSFNSTSKLNTASKSQPLIPSVTENTPTTMLSLKEYPKPQLSQLLKEKILRNSNVNIFVTKGKITEEFE